MGRSRLEGRSKVQQKEDQAVKATDLPKNKSLFMSLDLSVFICKVGVTAVLPKIDMTVLLHVTARCRTDVTEL